MTERASQLQRYLNLFRNVSNPGKYLKSKLGMSAVDPLEFELKGGLRVRVPKSRLTEFKCIVMDDCYLKGFKQSAFISPGIVVDVGANLGFFATYIKSVLPDSKVIGLEPLEGNYRFLQENLKLNTSHEADLIAVNGALASSTGELTLYSSAGDEEFPTDASMISNNGNDVEYSVPALSVRDLLEEYSIEEIALLKLDCEGAEFDIIYGTNPDDLRPVQNLVAEIHPGSDERENMKAFCGYLKEIGFACSQATDGEFLWASRKSENLIEPD